MHSETRKDARVSLSHVGREYVLAFVFDAGEGRF